MAKKEKLQLDDIDLDQDLDFDSFFADEVDGQTDGAINDKGSRTAVTDVFKGAIGGVKSKFSEPSFIVKAVRGSLPESYGQVFSAADDVIGTTSSLYDEAIREVKPQVSRLAKKLDRLVPEESKFFKKVTTKFRELAGDETEAFRPQSKEQQNEQSIQNSLAAVFDAQNEANESIQAREAAQDNINRSIENKKFHSSFSALKAISDSAERLVTYTEKVTHAYQKKSLELQFRSYFVQSELLQNSNKFNEIFKNQNDAVVKNTALPEYVKIKNSEKFKEIAKGKFIDNIQTSLFGDGSIVKTITANLKKQVKEGIAGFKEGAEAAMDGMDAVESMREASAAMEELGMAPDSKAKMAGGQIGGFIGDVVRKNTSDKIRASLPEDSPIGRMGYKLTEGLSNLQGKLNSAQDSDWMLDAEAAGGMKGAGAKAIRWLGDLANDGGPDMRIEGSGGIRGLDQPVAGGFNTKALTSLTEVIPGYLARIYREIGQLRSNDGSTDLTVFDYSTGKFKSQKDMSSDIKKAFSDKIKASSFGGNVKNVTESLTAGTELTEEQDKKIKKFISGLSAISMDYSPENIKNTQLFRSLDPETAALIEKSLDDKITNADEIEKNQSLFTKDMMKVRNSTTDIRSEIELFIKGGHGDILEEQGLVKRNKSGGYDIDPKAYKDLLDDETIVSSDVNVKRNISNFKPKAALEAVKKTKVYNWLYKENKGDEQPHTGPMAQDVNANMGEEAAPNGKAIDLTTMNGVNMSAIKALSDKQDQLAKGDTSQSILGDIKKDTKSIVELLKKGVVAYTGKPGKAGKSSKTIIDRSTDRDSKDILLGMVSDTLTLASNAGNSVLGASSKAYGFTKDKVAKPLAGLISNAYTSNKDQVANIFKSLFTKAGETALKVMDISKDIIFNKLPSGFKQLASLGQKVKVGLTRLIQGPIDVYVAGRDSPILSAALIKMGYYIDQSTGKVIETIDDIKGPVVNRLNEVVLTAEDIAKGLVDVDGKKILSPLVKIAKAVFTIGAKNATKAKDFFKNLLAKKKGEIGEDDSDPSKSILSKIKSIFSGIGSDEGSSKVYDVLVEIRDILRDRYGHDSTLWNDKDDSGKRDGDWQDRLDALKDKAKNKASEANLDPRYTGGDTASGLGSIAGLATGAASLAKHLPGMDKLKSLNTGAGNFLKKIPGVGKLGVLAGKIPGASKLGTFSSKSKDFISDKASKISEKLPMLDKLKAGAAGKITTMTGKSDSDDEPKTEDKKLKAKTGKPKWNDKDGSGKRDGDWQDRLDVIKERQKLKNKASVANLDPRYKSDKNVIDTIFGGVKDLLGMLSGGMSGIFSKASGVFKAVGGFLGIKSGAGILGNIKNVGGTLLKAPGKLLSGATKVASAVGKPLVAGVNAIKGVGAVGRIASAANTARNVLMVGSLATAGTGSAILGALGTGMSLIAGILGSPVVLGAAAIAAVGYGVYKAYKYFTRDNITDYEDIRFKQYGAADKEHNHKLVELEEYLNDGRVGYSGGSAFLLTKKLNTEEMLAMFSIDKEDSAMVSRYTEWFQRRFKPFFLTHLTALFSVNNKVKLDKLPNLKPEEQLKYLGLVSFESGPYNASSSPFKDTDSLPSNKDAALAIIAKISDKLKKDKTKTDGAIKDDGKQKALQDAAAKAKQAREDKLEDTKDKLDTQNKIKLPAKDDKIDTKNTPLDTGPTVFTPPIVAPNGQTVPPIGEEGDGKVSPAVLLDKSDKATPAVTGPKPVQAGGPIKDGSAADKYIKLEPDVNISNINPSLLQNFKAMVQDYGDTTGKSVLVTSGYRSKEKQAALHKSNPKKAAKPGKSLHEFGLALDVNSPDLNKLDELGFMRKYGFTRPVGQEPWHTEPAGIQGNIDKARSDKSFASQAVEASLFKGGGGHGTIKSAKQYTRNQKLALSLWDAGGKVISADKDKVSEMMTANVPQPVDEKMLEADKPAADDSTMSTSTPEVKPIIKDSRVPASGGYGGSIQAVSNSIDTGGTIGQASEASDDTEGKPKGSSSASPTAVVMPKDKPGPDSTIGSSTAGGKAGTDIGNVHPKDKEGIKDAIGQLSKKAGVDPNMMKAFAAVESSLNPDAGAKTSSAKGLFQFTKGTWKEQLGKHGRKYGLDRSASPKDIKASTLLASEYVKSNLKYIKPVKPDPTVTDVYLTHFLGAGGARKFLSSKPDDIGAKRLPDAAKANKPIFYNNASPLSISKIYDKLSAKISTAANSFGINVNASSLDDSEETDDTSTSSVASSANESVSPNTDSATGSNGSESTPASNTSLANESAPLVTASSKVANDPSYSDPIVNTGDKVTSADSSFGMQMPSAPAKTGVLDSPFQGSNLQASSMTDSGQGFGLDGLGTGIKDISKTLDKSLGVQSEMLSVLKQILTNANPENIDSTKEGLRNVADKQKASLPVPPSVIDLARKSA